MITDRIGLHSVLLPLLIFAFRALNVWRGILDKTVIGSYHKVHYIEFACILSYRTWYAVMSYSVMLYCNRNNVLKAPYDSELNIHIWFTIIIIYEVPNCTNWKAAHHIAYFHLVRLERKLDMMLSGTT